MKKEIFAMASVLLLIALAAPAKAANQELCGLMIEIYGVCSPELIDNYVAHSMAAPLAKTKQEAKAKLPGTGPAPNPLAIINSPSTNNSGAVTLGALKPAMICWHDIAGCKRCKLGYDGEQVITCPPAPQWYANKFWLIGIG